MASAEVIHRYREFAVPSGEIDSYLLDLPLVPLLVTHFARPDLLEQARQQGVVVVQSFEWD